MNTIALITLILSIATNPNTGYHIETTQGIVLDEYGNGLDLNATDRYNYISYRYIDPVPGEEITTYCIIEGEEPDNIIYRIDVKADGNVYINH